MRRIVIGVAVAAGLVALGVWWLTGAHRPEWTTRSPEALAELQAAMNARMKLYYADSQRHLERALTLDPDFVMARFMLEEDRSKSSPQRLEEFKTFLKGIDLGRLNARERLFVERARALVAGRPKEAERLLDLYLTRHPDDPFALNIKGTLLWYSGKLDAAKTVFEHLVKIAPNWVVAYNQLGYIAMEQGRFARAEDYFKTYGFIAPDQANPHDSLGELLTLTGRYDQAVEELHRALAVKPDFCASYEHLVLVHSLMGDLEAAGRDIEQATASGGCPQKVIEGLKCSVTAWPLETTHRWRELLEAVTGNGCAARLDWRGSLLITVHRARAFTGDDAGADELERRVAADLARVEKDPAAGPEITGMLRAELGHMRGVRAAASGRYDDAAGRLREADRNLTYRGAGVGLFKLFNRLALAEVLAAGGHPVQAAAVVRAVREVNPAMAAAFGSGHWRPLGLREGSAARR